MFVGLQLRQDREIAVSQLYADWDDTRIEWARLVNENDEIWIRGLKGEELDEKERLRFDSVATAWYHMENGRFIRASRTSLATPEGVALRTAFFVRGNPGLERWWTQRYEYRASIGSRNIGLSSEVTILLEELRSGERPFVDRDSLVPL